MNAIIPEQTPPCNNYLSPSLAYPRNYLTADQFSDTHSKKRAWLKAVTQEYKLKENLVATLEAFIFKADAVTGRGEPSLSTINENRRTAISYRTMIRHMACLTDKGVLLKFAGDRTNIKRTDQTPPNIYVMVGYEYKLEDYYDKLSHNLNNPTPIPKHTYLTLRKVSINSSNLQEALNEYAAYDQQLKDELSNKITKLTNNQHIVEQELAEAVKDLDNDTAESVRNQTYRAMSMITIKYPKAFVAGVVKTVVQRPKMKYQYSGYKCEDHERQQAYFREKAHEDMRITKQRMEAKDRPVTEERRLVNYYFEEARRRNEESTTGLDFDNQQKIRKISENSIRSHYCKNASDEGFDKGFKT